MRRTHIAVSFIALAAGLASAVALTFPHTADAWSYTSLPDGYSVSGSSYTDSTGKSCHKVWIDGHYMGDDCIDPAGLQENVDAYVNSTICSRNLAAGLAAGDCATTSTATTTDPATTTAAPPPVTTDTTATTTTAAAATTTAAADPSTTTAPTSTTPDAGTVTAASTAPTSTTAAPVPVATVTTVETTTVTTQDPALATRVTALEQEYTSLASRVSAIEDANAAAWQTFHDDLVAGMSAADAALDARSAGLNAIYKLA